MEEEEEGGKTAAIPLPPINVFPFLCARVTQMFDCVPSFKRKGIISSATSSLYSIDTLNTPTHTQIPLS